MTSSSGYITQFDKETNLGYIQTQDDETNTRYLKFRLHSLKKNSIRYVTKGDSTFVGELFDFDIIQHTDERQDEAINIRHRVLRCPTLGCSRIKAFTNRKALYEHIESKHCRVKKVAETWSQEVVTPKLQKKTATKQKPFIVNLVTKSAPVVGRFIDREQKNEEENFKRLQRTWIQKQSSTTSDIDFDSDMELDGDTRHARAFTISGDELIRRRSTRYEKKEATLGRRQARSILSLEGHRCAATQDRQQGGTKSVMFHQKKKTNMKDKQWMVKEQLDDMPLDVDDE
ncbi:unnamed protein product [Rotaria sp. Silwood1]|nr:unnamed protein product [Rotaria sp. Silwood1]CAF4850785.1 unnamed protein product [Rotaria sp. Silwood1]